MGPLEKELGKICFPFTLITNFLSLESKTLKFKISHQKPSKYQILQNVKKKIITYNHLKIHQKFLFISV